MQRKIFLKSLKSSHILHFVDDDSLDRVDRVYGGERQALIRALEKRIDIRSDVTGEVEAFPVFRLAEPPSINDPSFDDKYLKVDRKWILPDAEWSAVNAKFVGISEDKREKVTAALENKVGEEIVKSLTELVATRNIGALPTVLAQEAASSKKGK